ncbi:unnamed protein product [Candidula unifasciata]|uniref:G-protein coupled receptors family 1 profile domain-containing protein n=1 Tax=Candidula unifasciata TaxID=100452 RepID=A0A8S3ZY45_9EUPU|nr:unnamed protein product [Candidula unifasciata]
MSYSLQHSVGNAVRYLIALLETPHVAKHDWSQRHEIFLPVAILSIVIGVFGNMCFCFFFGDKTARIYKTRDALYFRRMSLLDMLVCVIVLPYSVFYEFSLVNYGAVCKTMEFIRHIIIYTSHLTLAAYCFELPRRVSYADVQANVNRMMVCNCVLAFVFSLPAFFLFDIGAVKNEEDGVTRNVCHLVVSFKNDANDYGSLSLLRVHYYAVMCLCYVVALVVFLFKIMHYCERLAVPGRRSVSVQLIERAPVRQLKPLKSDVWRHKVRRHSQTGRPIVFAEYTDRSLDDTQAENGEETNDVSEQDSSFSFDQRSSFEEDRNIQYWPSSMQENAEITTPFSESTSIDRIDSPQRHRRDSIVLNVKRLKSDTESSIVQTAHDSPEVHQSSSRGSSITSRNSSVRKKRAVFVVKTTRTGSANRLIGLFSWLNSDKNRKHSILKRNSSVAYLKIESYKQHIILLILLDFIFILSGVVSYILLDEHGATLYLIHTKCIFSFYLISLTHKGLRLAVQKHIVYYCFRTCKTKREVHHRHSEAT